MSESRSSAEKFTPASSGSSTTDHRDRERADFLRDAWWSQAIRALSIAYEELGDAEDDLRCAASLDSGILADDIRTCAGKLNEVRKKAIEVRKALLEVAAA